jgi:hypothetical protein
MSSTEGLPMPDEWVTTHEPSDADTAMIDTIVDVLALAERGGVQPKIMVSALMSIAVDTIRAAVKPEYFQMMVSLAFKAAQQHADAGKSILAPPAPQKPT